MSDMLIPVRIFYSRNANGKAMLYRHNEAGMFEFMDSVNGWRSAWLSLQDMQLRIIITSLKNNSNANKTSNE